MTTKTCTKCNQIKPLSEFHKLLTSKTGYQPLCKKCKSKIKRKTFAPDLSINKKICSKCKTEKPISNFDKNKYSKTGYQFQCKICRTFNNKPKQIKIKTCTKCKINKTPNQFNKNKNSPDGYDTWCKACHSKKLKPKIDKIKMREQSRIYYNKHKTSINKKQYQYKKNRLKTDIYFYLTETIRNRVRMAIKSQTTYKSKPTLKLLGCSIEYLKEHLQQTAINNGYINFDINNYSGQYYHIDHIIPCSKFDLSKSEEQEKCFHYSNLQILTAKENMIKSNY